jgi:hypothetical protein
MKRKADYPITKHSLNLRDGDWGRLQEMHPRLGAGRVIREMVIAHVDRVELRLGEIEVEPAQGDLP